MRRSIPTVTDMTITVNVKDLPDLVGAELGVSSWLTVDQAMIDAFADVTRDHSAIHVDPEHAAASPWGTTLTHGLLTLSLGASFLGEIIAVAGYSSGLSLGYDRVRFTAPVPNGSRLRMRVSVKSIEDRENGWEIRFLETTEMEGSDRPVCVSERISRYFR